jgi:putative transposase
MLKKHRHTPAHLYIDDTGYFITAAIYQKRPLLSESALKNKLLEFLQGYFDKHDWELHHWVILDNHYHLLGKSGKGEDMEAIFRNVHSQTAKLIRQVTACEKPVWWNYWDYCPRNEKDYMTRLNYLLINPVKHGYVTSLYDYQFSSFHNLFGEIGREQLVRQFQTYPDYKNLVLHEAKEDDF